MLESVDMSSVEDLQRVKRSIGMLPAGAWALRREESLQLLALLRDAERRRSV